MSFIELYSKTKEVTGKSEEISLTAKYFSLYGPKQSGLLQTQANQWMASLSPDRQLAVLMAYKQSACTIDGQHGITEKIRQKKANAEDGPALARQIKVLKEFEIVLGENKPTFPLSWGLISQTPTANAFCTEVGRMAMSVTRIPGPFANSRLFASSLSMAEYTGFIMSRLTLRTLALKAVSAQGFMAVSDHTPFTEAIKTPEGCLKACLIINPLNMFDCRDYRVAASRNAAEAKKMIAVHMGDYLKEFNKHVTHAYVLPSSIDTAAEFERMLREGYVALRNEITAKRKSLSGIQARNGGRISHFY